MSPTRGVSNIRFNTVENRGTITGGKVDVINFFQKDKNNLYKVTMYSHDQKRTFYGSLNEIEKMNVAFLDAIGKQLSTLLMLIKLDHQV
jgi:hypothetical protein